MLVCVVVVRTGDRTLIGQIAALTGGESGNKSPLAVEMYVSCFHCCPQSRNASIRFANIIVLLQCALRGLRLYRRYLLRHRLLHCRYHHFVQRRWSRHRHLRRVHFGRLRTRGFAIGRYSAVRVLLFSRHSRSDRPRVDVRCVLTHG